MAEKGYETGHHAPGLKLHGTGLYKAAHHIIKVSKVLLGARPGLRVKGRPPCQLSLPQGSEPDLGLLPLHLQTSLSRSTVAPHFRRDYPVTQC